MNNRTEQTQLNENWQVVYDLSKRVGEIRKLFQETYWAGWRSEEDIKTMLENSIVSVGLEPCGGGELVAYARVIGDGVFKAIVEDVIVTTELRGQGVGHSLMNALMLTPNVASVEEVELYCDPRRKRFYEDSGFTVVEDQLFMRTKGRSFDKY